MHGGAMSMAAVYKKLSNSPLTKSDTNILVPYIDSQSHSWYKKYGGYHTGVDVEGSEIYAYQSGVVIQIGDLDDGLKAVVIQYTANISLRYANMSSLLIKMGDVIKPGELIGIAKKFVHFEYLSKTKENSMWPVRVGTMTYFKHDPELIFDDVVKLNANDWSQIKIADTTSRPYVLRDSQYSEFDTDGSGGDR